MTLRGFTLSDYETLVSLYYDFMVEAHEDRKIGEKYFYYKSVIGWINDKKNIVLVENDGEICGFSLTFTDYNGGLTEPVLNAHIAYVRPEYRKTRVAYMLYHNTSEYAKENNLTISGYALVSNGASDMVEKHFNGKRKFINFERNRDEENN